MNTPHVTHIVKTDAELDALCLSIYTLSRLSDVLSCVDPRKCLEHRLTHPAFADRGWRGELTLDSLGNFVKFE